MTIWIARKHARHPYSRFDHLRAFEIVKTFATRKEAKEFVDTKMKHPSTSALYTVGKVGLK